MHLKISCAKWRPFCPGGYINVNFDITHEYGMGGEPPFQPISLRRLFESGYNELTEELFAFMRMGHTQ